MRKGFTLMELLGVIIVLGLLATIVTPIVITSINNNRERLYETQLKQIIKGAEDYYANNLSELPQTNGETKEITIQKLQASGMLKDGIKNPNTNQLFPLSTSVKITKMGENYDYCVVDHNC